MMYSFVIIINTIFNIRFVMLTRRKRYRIILYLILFAIIPYICMCISIFAEKPYPLLGYILFYGNITLFVIFLEMFIEDLITRPKKQAKNIEQNETNDIDNSTINNQLPDPITISLRSLEEQLAPYYSDLSSPDALTTLEQSLQDLGYSPEDVSIIVSRFLDYIKNKPKNSQE